MKNLFVLGFIFLLTACSSGPKEIDYSKDKCAFCTMNIADKRYGAELVTDKGKVYKFDSFECMLSYERENKETSFSHKLTATIDMPGTLQDANNCGYLRSPNLPSPMGANITAFSKPDLAKEAQLEYQGDVFSYDQIVQWFQNNGQHQPGQMSHPETMHNH